MNWIPEAVPVLGVIASTTAATIAAVSAVVSAATAVAGGVMGAISAKQQGEAAEEAAEYNAAVAQNDAIAAQNAAAQEARQIRRKNLMRLGAQRSSIAKSGVSMDAGSSFDDVIYDSAIQGELDAQSMLYSGLVRSQAQMAAGAMSLYEGQQAKRAAGIGMASSLIGGLGGVAQAGTSYLQTQPRLSTTGAKPSSPPMPFGGKPMTGGSVIPGVEGMA
jgi:hypothetical protein